MGFRNKIALPALLIDRSRLVPVTRLPNVLVPKTLPQFGHPAHLAKKRYPIAAMARPRVSARRGGVSIMTAGRASLATDSRERHRVSEY